VPESGPRYANYDMNTFRSVCLIHTTSVFGINTLESGQPKLQLTDDCVLHVVLIVFRTISIVLYSTSTSPRFGCWICSLLQVRSTSSDESVIGG
jgi:hypothetical protein